MDVACSAAGLDVSRCAPAGAAFASLAISYLASSMLVCMMLPRDEKRLEV
jgi:hypothetical protein